MTSFFRKLNWLLRRRSREEDLREELQFHLDEEAEEREIEGLEKHDAERAARRHLGNIALVQEDTRAAWGWMFVDQFKQDVHYAVRTMWASRAFTMLAVASLALGIGANTAIYSFMDAVLLRSLPVDEPESLVVLNWQTHRLAANSGADRPRTVVRGGSGSIYNDGTTTLTAGIFPFPAFDLLRQSESVLSSLFAYYPAGNLNIAIQGRAEIAGGLYVSGDYFRGLGVSLPAGRPIAADDDRAGAPVVAVISYAFSQGRFETPSQAAGQSIFVNNVPVTVVGVAPPGFFGADPALDPAIFLPIQAIPLLAPDTMPSAYVETNYYWVRMMGRLRPGVSRAAAQSALAPIFHRWVETTAANDQERANLPRLLVTEGDAGPDALRRRYARPLYVLMILVALILAVACANIANLLLGRAAARSREIALRLSLGAGRFRVVRQLLTESLLLGSLGGVTGIFVAIWGIRFLTLLLGNDPRAVPPRAELNFHVLGAAVVLSVLTGLLFGLAPAIRLTRTGAMEALKAVRAAGRTSRVWAGFSDMLIVWQVAMSLLMLVAAGLFLRTLSNLESVDLGFDRENLLLFDVNARQAGYRDAEMVAFYDNLYQRIGMIPGVQNISLSNQSLITAGFGLGTRVEGGQSEVSRALYVGPGFFSTLQIPIVLGREIGARDLPASKPVAVVSEYFVKTRLGNENPIGHRISVTMNGAEMEIVGVARDARFGGLRREHEPVVYMPYRQGQFPFISQMTFELRTAGDPLGYVNAVREIVLEVDARVPVVNVTTQINQINQTISQEILFARLCAAFAAVALAIACIGLYGTVAYNVARRTSEIGIRLALGAQRLRVIRLVMEKVMLSVLAALALGLPAALTASSYVESFLFALEPRDPLTIAMAATILMAAATLAAFVPAYRASGRDPLIALRHDQ